VDERTDLKSAFRELAAGECGGDGPHCGTRRLIAYREGSLPAAEREKVEEHLSRCPRCAGFLRELRSFETAAARGETGPASLRQEAWKALVRRLPVKSSAIRPVAPSAASGEPRRRFPRLVPGAAAIAAVLLFAILGLALWAAATVFQERQRLSTLERHLKERDATVAALQSALAETERQLDVAHRQIQDLENAKISAPAPAVVASQQIEVSVAPRYVLRGHEAPGGAFLREGEAGSVRAETPDHPLAVAFDLAGHPPYGDYRFELIDRDGKVLWSGRRPGESVLGDDGTSVSIRGLHPGRYRLQIAGLKPDGSEPLAEYTFVVE